ncbi:MAG: Ribosomal-protein-S18p-alanine acetyltransferase (EC [uncultured Thiotrichaceae bacterium]|uniref:[Ribosomal protein bS18]-alanine N-acetyltransferase n=1 Tax=uncultured Thiotrichaceae bacterium TaxID=298394 RepID=A0A6S6TRI1_9GAMM|nr:MAG: Ribosomal-protein-S18p-alanine acetyltransferase (EC [uncultured Thiotrichaceae bacterium]
MITINPESLSLRALQTSDIPIVMEIELRAYPHPWTDGIFNDCLRVGYSCWVYEHQDTIIGYLILSLVVDEMHILNICIDPKYQAQGLGKQLLEEAEAIGQEKTAKEVFLEVRPSNTAALLLYQDFGYNQIGLRKNYYPATNGREDAIVMAKTLFENYFSESE